MKKIAIVYGGYDGMHSHYCGVGTMTKEFILSFKEVVKELNNSEECFKLFPVCVKNTDFAISVETCEEIENVIMQYPQFYEPITWVDNGTHGKDPYGNVGNWLELCENVAMFLKNVSERYDDTIFIGLDGPYLGCARTFCEKYKSVENVYFVNVVYSSVLYNRDLPFEKSSNYSRLGWEHAAIDFYQENTHKNLIYANAKTFSTFMKKSFNLRKHLHFVVNGLYYPSMLSTVETQDNIEKVLVQYGIPTDKELMFTVGRCDIVKGFEYVIKLAEVVKERNIHTVILMSQCEQNPLYYKKIKELSNKEYITLIDKRDMNLPGTMYQWKNTHIVAALARKESAGLIPTESRLYHNKNCIVVVSKIEGLAEQVEDGVDGFVTGLSDDEIKAVGKKIINMPKKEQILMAERGYRKVMKQYNAVTNNRKFLLEIKHKLLVH